MLSKAFLSAMLFVSWLAIVVATRNSTVKDRHTSHLAHISASNPNPKLRSRSDQIGAPEAVDVTNTKKRSNDLPSDHDGSGLVQVDETFAITMFEMDCGTDKTTCSASYSMQISYTPPSDSMDFPVTQTNLVCEGHANATGYQAGRDICCQNTCDYTTSMSGSGQLLVLAFPVNTGSDYVVRKGTHVLDISNDYGITHQSFNITPLDTPTGKSLGF